MLFLVTAILGFIFVGYSVYKVTIQLFALYPLSSRDKFWATKFAPMFGFGIMLMSVGHSTASIVGTAAGAIIIFSSMAWASYVEKQRAKQTPGPSIPNGGTSF